MIRFSLLPNHDTRPISIATRAYRKDQVLISLKVPLAWTGALLNSLDALRELADGIQEEIGKAEMARKTKEARSMWARRKRAIRRAYYKLREKGVPHRPAVYCLVNDYRWKDLGWTFADFNRHVGDATHWQEAQ